MFQDTTRIERTKYILPEEFTKLLNAARKDDFYYHAFLICGNLGLRVSELIKLEKKDFDFDHNLVKVSTLKQRKGREIYDEMEVSPDLIKIIKPYIDKLESPETRLFNMTKRTVQYKFDYFAEKAGIKIKGKGKNKGRGIHCLRHMRGILLAAKTRDPYAIARALRHRNISTSMAYVHLTDGSLAKWLF